MTMQLNRPAHLTGANKINVMKNRKATSGETREKVKQAGKEQAAKTGGTKAGVVREKAEAYPNMTRKEFIAWFTEWFDASAASASTYFYNTYKPAVKAQ